MNLINTDEQLTDFCKILEQQTFITVDSEFIREHSYYPKLCLLQIGYDGDAAIIDPLANLDLSPFFEILQNPNIIKVFHSGRQDIEIFYNLTGKVPQNVFDTQIAAMVCGFTENISYGNLVHAITHTELDKSCRLTDWSKRPLEEDQLEYALGDVTYLVDCYKYLRQYMEENNRLEWIKEEIADLCDEKHYNVNPAECWKRLRHSSHSQQYLSALKYLAEWRECRAQKFNTPRSSVLKDEVLLNIASAHPKTVEELRCVRNLRPDIAKGKMGEEILLALKQAGEHPLSAEICRLDRKEAQNGIPNHEQSLMEILRLLLKIKSQEADVCSRLIASDEDLRYIIVNLPEKTPSMQGWRYEIFGQYAELLKKGKLAITYNQKKKSIDIKEI
ncbi:MAG: ribonuclease D [Alphaproteobacteria bacterium]|nr:ribonuclease D [Alphaproteobacteria bacterium]